MERLQLELHNNLSRPLANIAVIQQNISADDSDPAIVWRVLTIDDVASLTIPSSLSIQVTDEFGNRSAKLPAQAGEAFEFIQIEEDNHLVPSNIPTSFLAETEIHNKLEYGAVTASVFKDGRLIAAKTDLHAWRCAYFSFRPKIWIGCLDGASEGHMIDMETVMRECTEISLEGTTAAAVVIRNGVAGEPAIVFELCRKDLSGRELDYEHAV